MINDIERATSAMLHLDPSMAESDWWRVAAAARAAGVEFDDFDRWSSAGQNYKNTQDCRATWNAHPPRPSGIDAGTLFAMAKRSGWKPPKYPKAPGGQAAPVPRPQAPAPQPEPSPEARAIWDRAVPLALEHAYCRAKKLTDPAAIAGMRVLADNDSLVLDGIAMAGAAVVPLYRPGAGEVQAVQCIATDGRKRTKGKMADAHFTVGAIEPGQPAYIVEGVGTAWAVWEATGCAALVTCGVGRTATVAAAVKAHHPDVHLTLVPDVGQEQAVTQVAQKLGCAVANLPGEWERNTDAWDFLQVHGHGALAGVLESAAAPADNDLAEAPAQPQAQSDDDGIEAPHASEIELAERFAERCAAQFRWTPGMDWMHNAGTHWERDDHLRRFNVAKAVCRGAAAEVEKPSLAAKLCSANTSGAVLSLARSEPSIVTPVSEWDKHPMLLNTPGDCYDLETGLPVSRTGLLFTQVTGAAPAHMPIPVWEKFISEVFDHDVEMIEFIQRLAGYTLTGSVKEQKIFFMHGEGANGKSVLLEVLRATAGRYAHNLPSEALMTAKHERHPTTFAALQGKRLAISSEIEESSHWAEARIKQLTGDATLTARYMRGDEFTFNVTHKHVLAGNFKPRLKGDDHAMVRRMVLIPFSQRFTGTRCDDRLPEKLKAEYPGILSWAIEGARKWAADGLRIPGSVTDSSKEYMAEQNDIELWTGECCNVGNGLRAKSSDLYASYAAWKLRNGENAGSSKVFSQRLERKFTKAKSDGLMVFKGLQLRPEHQQNDYLNQSRGF